MIFLHNINDNVWVKLTQNGRDLLERDHYAFWRETGHPNPPAYVPPVEVNGHSKWQMWDLMAKLGKYQSMGADNVFETEILLDGEAT